MPARLPATRPAESSNTSVCDSTRASAARGISGIKLTSTRSRGPANAAPLAAPANASTSGSASTNRTMDAGDAPSAVRTPNSLARRIARAVSNCATFAVRQ
jgi:hypothetical protein